MVARVLCLTVFGAMLKALGGVTGLAVASSATTKAFSAILAWALFVGITVIAMGVTVLVTRHAYGRLSRPPLPDLRAGSLAVLVGLVTFAGGWLFVTLFCLGIRGSRLVRRLIHPV